MKFRADIDLEGSARIVNLPDPIAAQHAATQAYVLAQITAAVEGIKHKDPVRVRTTANVNLAAPGASLDGVAFAAGERFYADGQTTTPEKGIYVWNGAASPATRAIDGSTFTELVNALIAVAEGTDTGKIFRQTVATGTIGVTTPILAAFGTVAGAATETSAGIAEIATQAEADTGTDDLRFVTPLKMANWAGRAKRGSLLFGDGAATSYVFTHSLNTKETHVEVYIESTGEQIQCNIVRALNSVTVSGFIVAPALNTLRVIVIA